MFYFCNLRGKLERLLLCPHSREGGNLFLTVIPGLQMTIAGNVDPTNAFEASPFTSVIDI